ncbi:MAG TPA: hypothetical protein VG028_06055 [Terriglobia bacterium]|nr:hypothetical protein [Terriglobia bacterium]
MPVQSVVAFFFLPDQDLFEKDRGGHSAARLPIVGGKAGRLGLAARFLAEGWLAVRYGARAEAYLKANVAWVSLAVAVAAATVAYQLFTRRSSEAT